MPHYVESLFGYSILLFRKGRRRECLEFWEKTETWLVPLLKDVPGRGLEVLLFFYHSYFDFVNDQLKDGDHAGRIANVVTELLALDKPIDGVRQIPLENHVIFMLDFAFTYNRKTRIPEYLQDAGRSRCEALFKKMYGSTEAAVRRNLISVPWFGQKVV